jgi:hypothetical protein
MQVSQVLRALPVVCLCAWPQAPRVAAQARYRVTIDGEWFYQEASGKRLARLARGAMISGAAAQGDWVRVTMEGWIFGSSVGPTPRAGFDLAVTKEPEENLRSAPAGALVAKLASGFLLNRLDDAQRPWIHVKRDGWMRREALEPVAQVAATSVARGSDSTANASPSPAASDPARDSTPAPAAADPARAQSARQTTVYRAPEGPAAGSVTPDTPLKVLGRSGEWSRVQFEGWVKTADIQTAPPGVLMGISAAELRADPQRYQGQVLRWDLQFIAVQTADDLRPDIPEGATYLLTRGPLPERGFVYVVVSEAQKAALATLTPLVDIRVTARVRAGRSRFLGNPVVDLVTMESQP